jgi:inorganic pyrophosphatase
MKLTELPLGDAAPKEVNAVVEIPKNSKNKYEYRPEWNAFFLDRVLSGPLRFPTAYGFIPQTVAPDGDEVDVLIIQDEPVEAGTVMAVRPIGMFSMDWPDSDKRDIKIVAVSANDPMYEGVHGMDRLPPHFFTEIDYFFRTYLSLEDSGIKTEWDDVDTALRMIEEGHTAFNDRADRPK